MQAYPTAWAQEQGQTIHAKSKKKKKKKMYKIQNKSWVVTKKMYKIQLKVE